MRNEVYHQVTTAMVEHGGGGDESSDGGLYELPLRCFSATGRRGESSGRDAPRLVTRCPSWAARQPTIRGLPARGASCQGGAWRSTWLPTVSSSDITIAVCWAVRTATTLKVVVNELQGNCHESRRRRRKGRTILEVDDGSGPKPLRGIRAVVKGRHPQGCAVRGQRRQRALGAFCPLGEVDDYVRVMHPAFMQEKNGSLTTFADARVGMEVMMLEAKPETLVKLISTSTKGLVSTQ